MRLEGTSIEDVKIIHMDGFADTRGRFFESFDVKKFESLGLQTDFVMDATSQNTQAGTIRGLHFQAPPNAQAKLVRASRGRALDIAVDIRRDSPTFGRHVAITLSELDLFWLYIPCGFAHGFCTLEDNTEILYKLTDHYAPEVSKGILWNDPALAIDWPVTREEARLSDKDLSFPHLCEAVTGFNVNKKGKSE
jgi:dTDP-4-dehydrorhamnose 3,5-epimerase